MILSVGSMATTYSTVEYLYRRGIWNPYSVSGQHLQTYYLWAILISFVLAVVGMFRDRNIWIGTTALVISAFGLLVGITA
jgi:hypothetical protein